MRAAGKRGRLRVVSDVAPDMFRVAIRGTLATVEADLFSPYLRLEGDPDIGKRAPLGQIRNGLTLIRAGVRNFREKVLQHGTYHGMPRMLDAIYRSIRDDTPPPVSERDMVASARLIDRLIQLGPPR
ncbi:MAG TPA: hypothetical protein VK485_08375 [Sphingomicrobium sp.]|nr:hypothetical protein [Sphingomicrobium sp.]